MRKRKYRIHKVAVLGSGVMGKQIAAHCVNAGLQVMLLDMKSDNPDDPNKIVRENLEKAKKMKPAPFGLTEFADQIQIGNFDDDFDKLRDADWICEVIIEKMDIKQDMMERIESVRKDYTIVSTNTSGLPISEIADGRSESFKKHFLGTHFFNPPRYMKLLEIIPTASTDDEVTSVMRSFCEKFLGKGIVMCKDTPNFIANRIGIFSIANIMPYFFNGSLRAEEIDTLTGTLTGYSKAATFRTADMAGLDVTGHVAENLYPKIPEDEMREVFKLPETFKKMVKEGKTGNKAGEGFYKKTRTDKGTEYKVINPETLEYESQEDVSFDELNEYQNIKDTGERLKAITFSDTEAGRFVWQVQRDLLLYAANRIPEITDNPISIDRAMQWGFNWELGPFQRWDALGIEKVVQRLSDEGQDIPEIIQKMMDKGVTAFYDTENDRFYHPVKEEFTDIPLPAKGMIRAADLPVIKEKEQLKLKDMGDGVALFEFNTKNQTLGNNLVTTLYEWLNWLPEHFDALVIGHDHDNFSYGANLKEAVSALKNDDKESIFKAIDDFQQTAVALRYSPVPVVTAPFSRTFGGGTEFCLYSDRVVAHHELYMGLVEISVGLIPAGGGTTELLRRSMNRLAEDADPLAYLRETFKTLGMAKVSESAHQARQLHFLREQDRIVMNKDLLLAEAKREARYLADNGYTPPQPVSIKATGKTGKAALKLMLYIMSEGNFITEYDKVVANRIAHVLSGGELSEEQELSDCYFFELERRAIKECMMDERTVDRMTHMLETGKPLRN